MGIATAIAIGSIWWFLRPANRILGKWVDASGEVWEFRPGGVLLTTNKRFPERSYRWGGGQHRINIFYEPHQQSSQGVFEVSITWNTLELTRYPRVRYPVREKWVFHRLDIAARTAVVGAGTAGVGAAGYLAVKGARVLNRAQREYLPALNRKLHGTLDAVKSAQTR